MQLNDNNSHNINNSPSTHFPQKTPTNQSTPRIHLGTPPIIPPSKSFKNKSPPPNLSYDFIADNFVLLNLAGKGAFGEIYLSYSLRDDIEVAIKKEYKRHNKPSHLKTEAKIYQTILNINLNDDLSGSKGLLQQEIQGIPKFYGVGELPDSYYLIIEFLGPNLSNLLSYCKTTCFSIPCVCLLAIQFINRLEILHKNNFIHRDIKPENFVIGTDAKSNIIYLVDFGLSKRYRNPKNNQHIPYREGRPLTGTARYVSVNTHLGIEQSRRDDLESVGYMCLFLLKGSLPWKGLRGGENKYTRIMERKLLIPPELLCSGLPREMGKYIRYCKNLKFEDRPDYDYLRGLFVQMLGYCINVYGVTREYLKFDWSFEEKEQSIWKFFKQRQHSKKYIETSLSHTNTNYKLYGEGSENEGGGSNSTNNAKSNADFAAIVNGNHQGKYGRLLTKIDERECDSTIIKKTVNEKGNKMIIPKTDEMIRSEYSEISGSVHSENNTLKECGLGETEEKQSCSNDKKSEDEDKMSNFSQKTEEIDYLNKEIIDGMILPNDMKTITYNDKEDIDKYVLELIKKANAINNDSNIEINEEKKVGNDNKTKNKVKHTEYFVENEIEENENEDESDDDYDIDDDEDDDIEVNIQTNKNRIQPKNSEYINRNRLKKKAKSSNSINDNNDLPNHISSSNDDSSKVFSRAQTILSQKPQVIITNPSPNSSHLPSVPLSEPSIKISKANIIKINKSPLLNYYKILHDLGSGSFGQVKKVQNLKLKELRAMKIVSKTSKYSKNEINILKRISHPNIVNIYEIFEDSKKYYIMYELIEGGELFEAITTEGYFTEKHACMIMKQLLTAINYLHNLRIVHRDLKPENIMLVTKSTYELKIIDFGSATTLSHHKLLSEFIGTCYYIAPEVLCECYNEKCDIWSCGVIMYILLCGYPPFNGSSNDEIYMKIRNTEPSFDEDEWSFISQEAISLIKLMLIKKPLERINAENALQHEWFKMFGNGTNIDDGSEVNVKETQQEMQVTAIKKMGMFVKENRLKQAVLQFISTQFNLNKEEEQLRNMFKQFDRNKKGMITKEIFMKKLEKYYGFNDAMFLTEKMFGKLDLDGSGEISYSEFITSLMDDKQVVTVDRLDKAFKLFDKDGNGKLSIEEIMHVFGGDGEAWKEVIQQIDKNNDGEVDFEEFKILMLGLNSQKLI